MIRLLQGSLGPDPLKPLEHGLGLYALRFLLGSLLISPLRDVTGVSLLRFRRAIGVWAFIYAALHLMVWLLLDLQLLWAQAFTDLAKRPYLLLGMAAFLMLIPLVWTSRDSSIRRLGRGWRKLHLLALPAGCLGALHYALSLKTWQIEPILYLGFAFFMIVWRQMNGRLL